jgi:hypothetical protein
MAWVTMALGIVAYELIAPEGQLLSEAVDRFLVKHPVVTRVVVISVAAHLLNVLPNRVDPIHQIATISRERSSQGLATYRVKRMTPTGSILELVETSAKSSTDPLETKLGDGHVR